MMIEIVSFAAMVNANVSFSMSLVASCNVKLALCATD